MNKPSAFCSVEDLEKLVAEDRTELQRLLQEIHPKYAQYALKHFGCIVKMNSFATIEGHLSVHLLVYPVQSNKCTQISLSMIEAVGLNSTLHRVVNSMAQALTLTYACCEWCLGKHKQTSCPPCP